MTDRSYLDSFEQKVVGGLPKRLVATFTACHRDPSLRAADVVTLLKDVMEQSLAEGDDAPDRTDGP